MTNNLLCRVLKQCIYLTNALEHSPLIELERRWFESWILLLWIITKYKRDLWVSMNAHIFPTPSGPCYSCGGSGGRKRVHCMSFPTPVHLKFEIHEKVLFSVVLLKGAGENRLFFMDFFVFRPYFGLLWELSTFNADHLMTVGCILVARSKTATVLSILVVSSSHISGYAWLMTPFEFSHGGAEVCRPVWFVPCPDEDNTKLRQVLKDRRDSFVLSVLAFSVNRTSFSCTGLWALRNFGFENTLKAEKVDLETVEA